MERILLEFGIIVDLDSIVPCHTRRIGANLLVEASLIFNSQLRALISASVRMRSRDAIWARAVPARASDQSQALIEMEDPCAALVLKDEVETVVGFNRADIIIPWGDNHRPEEWLRTADLAIKQAAQFSADSSPVE